ncbi:TIGR01244 family sulfur transferase [Pelagerythrobacter rhizovicinus]|uniref:TIGR01244 family phosphatase n=1 Tax=Pelagerythrobacter rhizovicinus TaxID=2268576 RepID=A0A4Q2KI64_9SPHN|nr:TIGR01244 family sulfur transferase [Pelagerythrobacter rhizovicinus]RXZ64865.1 TIGR01244 family phosphatase [Pelagerythrobacter rhizovicinus]
MSDFRVLSATVLASPQIAPADVSAAKAKGVTLIVNNRPDGEADDQPTGAEIEAAARAAGLDYLAIPIGGSGFGEPQVRAMADALARAEGKVLAYCRSGTRSTLLWALAQAQDGRDSEEIAAAAAAAGYDVTPVRAAIDMLAARARG